MSITKEELVKLIRENMRLDVKLSENSNPQASIKVKVTLSVGEDVVLEDWDEVEVPSRWEYS